MLFLISFLFIFVCSFIFALSYNRHFLVMIMFLELLLISISLLFQFIAVYHDLAFGLICSMILLTIAACESSVGLALAVASKQFKLNLIF